jgi:hypothetical protein
MSKHFNSRGNFRDSDMSGRDDYRTEDYCRACQNHTSECNCSKYMQESVYVYDEPRSTQRPRRRGNNNNNSLDCGAATLTSMITPTNNLLGNDSKTDGRVRFTMRRKNKTVTLQWENFSGNLAANGAACLEVNQGFSNLPEHPLEFPIRIMYKDTPKMGYLSINPHEVRHFKFYLDISGKGVDNMVGDTFTISASTATWITE